jgi:uncharacterized protein YeaO (DUF488 family)
MIYTASYGMPEKHVGKLVSISNSNAKGFENIWKKQAMVPEWGLVKLLKEKKVSWNEYRKCYLEMLETNVEQINCEKLRKIANDKNKHITLLCWEKDSSRCHRSLVAEWLKEREIEVVVN